MTTRRILFLQRVMSVCLTLSPVLFTTSALAADQAPVATQTIKTTLLKNAPDGPNTPLPNLSPGPGPATASIDGLYHVSADQTPSGFAVPRFVSLKFGKVNARTGPSRNHSIAYQYQRRGLPVIVVAETEMWRKIRDMSGDEAWVRKPALSGKLFAVLTTQARLYAKPDPSARTLARIEQGALVQLEDCSGDDYCRIRTANGIKGFAPKNVLWGAQTIN